MLLSHFDPSFDMKEKLNFVKVSAYNSLCKGISMKMDTAYCLYKTSSTYVKSGITALCDHMGSVIHL